MPQVIEWTRAGPDDVVWRYPVEQIITGAQLVVHEFEAAVFLRDGKAYDVFSPGRHTLTTLNLPLISKAYGIFFGGKNPFTAIVIYVSTKQFAGKWGAKAQTTELAPLMVHGTAWFRIKDPNLFVNEVVGGQGAYNTGQVDDFIRGFINERVIDVISKYDLATAFTQLDKASTDVKVNINDALNRLGTDLVDFKFEGIDTSDQFRDRLFWIKQRAATSDVLRMETAKDIGASLGASQGGGAGLGAGMVLIPQVMNAQMQQPMMQPQAQVTVVTCPKCGNQVQQGARFCPNCGNTMTPPQAATSDVLRMETAKDIGASLGASQGGAGFGSGMVLIPQVMGAQMQQPMTQPQAQVSFVACPKCGNQVQLGARFCPNCGNTMTPPQTATSPCPNCGKPVTAGAKFCPECGQKI